LSFCDTSSFENTDFINITTATISNPAGGAVYVVLKDIEPRKSESITFYKGIFRNCTAPGGRGGAIYLKFTQDISCDGDFNEYRHESYHFIEIELDSNKAVDGSNVFIEAKKIKDLFTKENFEVKTDISGAGVNEYVGLNNCDNSLVSIVYELKKDDSDGKLIFVSGNDYNLDCNANQELLDFSTCDSLKNALLNPSTENITIEIIDYADLMDAVTIYGGSVVIIGASSPSSYVILVIGLFGTIYVESGKLPFSYGRMTNEAEGADVTFTKMNIRLTYKLGAITNPFAVVRHGIVTFDDCLFRSAGDSTVFPTYVSVYIADVINNGKLILNNCDISNLRMEGNVLIHGYDVSEIEIKVLN
jgi:hypothetical protein